MQLVPIPDDDVLLHAPLWGPFLEEISHRNGEPLESLTARVVYHEIQPILVWDEAKQRTAALVGVRFCRRGSDVIGEVVWLTGRGMRRWLHLRPELERYLKEHCGCTIIRPIARPGWSRLMKPHGYVVTHHIMEKRL
jgi:hypothetical protein